MHFDNSDDADEFRTGDGAFRIVNRADFGFLVT